MKKTWKSIGAIAVSVPMVAFAACGLQKSEDPAATYATFAEKYGDRPSDYWYATVDEIFAYADAMAELTVTATEVKNPTAIPLYVELDGKRLTIPPHSSVEL